MERLTKKSERGVVWFIDHENNGIRLEPFEMDSHNNRLAIEKLAEYEDLEEQGLLLKLPCKVRDTVYAYCSEFGILPYEVDCIVFDDKITYQCSSYSEPIGDCPIECLDEIEPDILDFGKTVFLTQAEAEEALKRMEREE